MNPEEPDHLHWERVYASRSDQEIGWFPAKPVTSVRLVEDYAPDRAAPVVDIGGGAARLVDRLLDDGYRDVTVLDFAGPALDQVRERLGTFAPDGPAYCSGLPVCRYGPDAVAAIFAPAFGLEHHEREIHVTPAGVEQAYSWVVLRRG